MATKQNTKTVEAAEETGAVVSTTPGAAAQEIAKKICSAVSTMCLQLEYPTEAVDEDGTLVIVNGMSWAHKSIITNLIYKVDQFWMNALNGRFDKAGKLQKHGEGIRQLNEMLEAAVRTTGAPHEIDKAPIEARLDDKQMECAVWEAVRAGLCDAFERFTGEVYLKAAPAMQPETPQAAIQTPEQRAAFAQAREDYKRRMGLVA